MPQLKKGKKNITIILGTKAQLIKMAPVMLELRKRKIPYSFIFTGQHKETITELLNIFKLEKPDFILYNGKDITRVLQMLIWGTRCLYKILRSRKIFFSQKGFLLIQGDTASTVLGAIVGKLCGQEIGYVEAGMRSFDLLNPFPEEIFRIICSNLADVHFCPGQGPLRNSKKYKGVKINTKANTLVNSLEIALKNIQKTSIEMPKEKFCIVSIHRFENIFNKDRMKKIVKEILLISARIKVLFIIHKPTEEKLKEFGLFDRLKNDINIDIRPKYDYFKFIKLLYNSEFIVTDGGGNQEESYYLGKPCLLMRSKTEHKEGKNINVVIFNQSKSILNKFFLKYGALKKGVTKPKANPSKVVVDYFQKMQVLI
ncbi:MAG: hypothetical protein A2W22_03510 [Candidatus Levybacteria bacterium RBG_16_35_11]|nr:MAG: hypothetical protein A2W22_03510 [Candidatus Levybacteria bacterium RBG_16_35_11]